MLRRSRRLQQPTSRLFYFGRYGDLCPLRVLYPPPVFCSLDPVARAILGPNAAARLRICLARLVCERSPPAGRQKCAIAHACREPFASPARDKPKRVPHPVSAGVIGRATARPTGNSLRMLHGFTVCMEGVQRRGAAQRVMVVGLHFLRRELWVDAGVRGSVEPPRGWFSRQRGVGSRRDGMGRTGDKRGLRVVWPDGVPGAGVRARMMCTCCEIVGADARPN